MLQDKIVLVTGGAGYIGGHLCQSLLSHNCREVVSLDNYSSGSEENHVPGVNYIRGSTSDISGLLDFVPDIIFHLGEYSRVEQSFDDYEKIWEMNKIGTYEVLEFCRRHGCKLIYCGSSTKFGDGGLGRAQSPYAWSKASNTELVINYGKWFNLRYAITYFYNVYGGREIMHGNYATLIGIFKRQCLAGKALTVVKPGTQKRNFTHIDDIIFGLILVGDSGEGDEFGIGSNESFSVIEVAKMFSDNIVMLPERRGNRMSADLMVEKTRQLGWEPKFTLREHVENFVRQSLS